VIHPTITGIVDRQFAEAEILARVAAEASRDTTTTEGTSK
jgi:hypothetical protein